MKRPALNPYSYNIEDGYDAWSESSIDYRKSEQAWMERELQRAYDEGRYDEQHDRTYQELTKHPDYIRVVSDNANLRGEAEKLKAAVKEAESKLDLAVKAASAMHAELTAQVKAAQREAEALREELARRPKTFRRMV